MILFFAVQVWHDSRTAETVETCIAKTASRSLNHFRDISGLPITTYFSAVKLRWLLDNVEEVRQAVVDGRCMFGTVDSWLVWVSCVDS